MKTKGHEETLGDDEYVCYVDCGDGVQVHTCAQAHQRVCFELIQSLCISTTCFRKET